MPRAFDTGAGHKAGDLIWSPNGELEWCRLVTVTSATVYSYFRPSTATTLSGVTSLLNLPPSSHRPTETSDTPIRPGWSN